MRHSIWVKLGIASACLLLSMWAVQLINFFFVLMPLAEDIESQISAEHLTRVESIIEHQYKILEQLAQDWAVWDDSYEFIDTPTAEFVDSNMTETILQDLGLDALLFYNAERQLIWGKTWDIATAMPLELRQFPIHSQANPGYQNALMPQRALQDGHPTTGLLNSDGGIMLVSINPVLPSDQKTPANGFLVMGRLLHGITFDDIQSIAKADLEVASLAQEPLPAAMHVIVGNISSSSTGTFLDRSSNSQIMAYTLLTDIFGDETILLKVSLPRKVGPFAHAILHTNLWLTSIVLLLIISAFFLMIYALIIRPIRILRSFVGEATDVSHHHALLKPELPPDEIGQLGDRFYELVSTLRNHSLSLHELSLKDELTGIANRRMAQQHLQSCWQDMRSSHAPLSVLICDIDHFKRYNDHYGHARGDQALKDVANALARAVNKRNDLAARMGGEEFFVILPHTDADAAQAVAERVVKTINELQIPHAESPTSSYLSISCGVGTLAPDTKENLASWLEHVDGALYAAKHQGRNRYHIAI